MQVDWFAVLMAAFFPAVWAIYITRHWDGWMLKYRRWAYCAFLMDVVEFFGMTGFTRELCVLLSGANVFLALFMLWWTRPKNRKKVRKLVGDKSRAAKERIVRKVRELKPRPVLRPVPGMH